VGGARTKGCIGRQFLGCLKHQPVVGEYKPGSNRRLSLAAAFEQSALDKQAVDALASLAHGPLIS
jgi:hypothetical protein